MLQFNAALDERGYFTMSDTSFLQLLAQKALPWAGQWEVPRFLVACSSKSELLAKRRLPENVNISPRPFRKGASVRGPRAKVHSGTILRRWPKAGLDSKRVPLLACTVQGRADLCFGDYILHCPEGHFVLQPPGVPAYDGTHPHLEGESRQRDTCKMLSFAPWNEYTIHCWMCESQGEKHRTLVNYYVHSRPALMYLKAVNGEGEAQRSDYEQVCRALLVALFTTVQREISEGNFVQWISAESRPPEHLNAGDVIAGAQKYMNANLSEALTIERVAHEVFLSRSLFAREFRKKTGQTFVEYLTQCRLAQAKVLLRETDWPIADIGRAVGLKPSRLLEIFHAHLGMAPSKFRETAANSKDRR